MDVAQGEILILWKPLRAPRKILFQVFLLLSDSLHHFCKERDGFFSLLLRNLLRCCVRSCTSEFLVQGFAR